MFLAPLTLCGTGLSGIELKKLICAFHHYNLNVFPECSDRLVPTTEAFAKVAVAPIPGKVAPVDLRRGPWVLNKQCAAGCSGRLNASAGGWSPLQGYRPVANGPGGNLCAHN